MKVLSVVPGLDPGRGGMASAATNMLIAARMAGVDSAVAVPEHRNPDGATPQALIDLVAPSGVVVKVMPTARWPPGQAYRWGMSPAQTRWVMRNAAAFDVVHVHGVWGMSAVGGLTAGWLASRPVVVTPHESLTTFDIEGSRSPARRRQKLLLKSLYLRYTTLFLLTSELEARQSLPATVQQRTVHYPVPVPKSGVPPIRPRGQQRELRVGFLARVDPKKNLDLLIDAMARLPEHVRLVIAGSGPSEMVAGLRAQAEHLGVQDRLEWLGFVEPHSHGRLLSSLDLLAMPSAFESFGLSAAEAMMHGLPVLVSEQTGIAEVIARHGGGRIIAANVSAIATAIGELDANRSALGAIGARGQAAVAEHLSSARIGVALRDAYAAAVASHLVSRSDRRTRHRRL